jgi:phage-related minor tail protein
VADLEAGRVITRLGTDNSGFNAGLDGAGSKLSSFMSGFGDLAARLNVANLSMTAFIGVTVAAGEAVEGAMQRMEQSTGATGAALDALHGQMMDIVNAGTTASLNQVGDVLGLVQARTHLAKDAAEELASSFLKVGQSALGGGDVSGVARTGLAVMAAWHQGADAIDKAVVVAQKADVPVTQVLEMLKQYQGNLQGLGYSFDQASALIGSLEQHGQNADKILGSLKIAMNNVGGAGHRPGEADLRRARRCGIHRGDQIRRAGCLGDRDGAAGGEGRGASDKI